MIDAIVAIVVGLALAATIYYFLKKATTLIINSVVGLVTLVIVNQLDLFGFGGIPITWASVLICALGGLPGALLLIVFHLAGLGI
jgi:hypothetical protein